jgi:putative ABC transport system permease protein
MNNSWKFIKDALESLSANKLRTGLTMLGIVIGVAAVISMLSIGAGAQSSITDTIEGMGTNLLFVTSNTSVKNAEPLTMSDAEAIKNAGETASVVAVAPAVSTSKTISFSGNSMSVSITGLTPEYAQVRNQEVSNGRFITQVDVDNKATVAVVGMDIVNDLFDGSVTDALSNKLRISNNLYQIIGVLKSEGGTAMGSSDTQVYVPISTAQSRLITRSNARDAVNIINISAAGSEEVNNAMSAVTSILRSRHGLTGDDEDDFSILSQEAFTEAASTVTGVFTIFLGGIAGISLLVGGIGIMNIMLVSVIERTKEIGLRKAVGARDGDIMLQFLVEALVIGLFGGLIGVLMGWGISALIGNIAINSGTAMNTTMTIESILLSVTFSIAVGLVFGIYPARRAAKLEPVEALRTE